MFILKLLSQLPFGVLYVFSDFLYFVAYHVIRYRRALVNKNLRNSFPEKTDDKIKKIEKAFYKNLCDYAVETLKLLTISREELGKRMRFNVEGFIDQFVSKNQS